MAKSNNILFIMCDQLRFDYLSCYGHKTLQTPHIDNLAKRGMRFSSAYCQAPLCAPSRASFYSGRYVSSHGVMGNMDATQVGEMMIADYLRPLGYRSAVVGKTHSFKSEAELRRLGVDMDSDYARASYSGGFEPYQHHNGLYPGSPPHRAQGYNDYLKSVGYDSDNPWETHATSGVDENGKHHSGWSLRSSQYPAAVEEQHSETAFSTRRAMDFIDETGDRPWCLHLSYIKPHWPLIAPDPYHQLFTGEQIQPVVCSEQEREDPHPVYRAFMQQEYSESYSREEVRRTVIPAYMGLVKQVDDHLGQLFAFMEARELLDNTLIVFTSDHGDYLGDHWLGEKDLFHDASVKIPMIMVDPRKQADATRGSVSDLFVGAIDLLPSLLDYVGAEPCHERLEGRSLMPLLKGQLSDDWRDYSISEIDYSDRGARTLLKLEPYQCRATMLRDKRWKYIHHQQFEAQLFDLENDPDELVDMGRNAEYAAIATQLKQCIVDWRETLKMRTGLTYAEAEKQGPELDEEGGIIIGRW